MGGPPGTNAPPPPPGFFQRSMRLPHHVGRVGSQLNGNIPPYGDNEPPPSAPRSHDDDQWRRLHHRFFHIAVEFAMSPFELIVNYPMTYAARPPARATMTTTTMMMMMISIVIRGFPDRAARYIVSDETISYIKAYRRRLIVLQSSHLPPPPPARARARGQARGASCGWRWGDADIVPSSA